MSAATMQSTPAIPPRPSRGQDNNASQPLVPPRPARKFNRSVSPNPDRFAPSPLNEHPFVPKSPRHSQSHLGESIQRSTSVDMPGVGQEGQEYAVAIEEMATSSGESRPVSGSPEQTRTVGENLKLYAPKPTMPAQSAKQRVAAVTRTDSDRAASFGIGRPSSDDHVHSANRSLRKKASTASQLSHHSESHAEDDHGIPEIGQRVPMLLNAGDVQAPSPAPPRAPSVEGNKNNRHHVRRTSSRSGFGDLPPGSYGLHGHGVASTDKLEKAYYDKHPDLAHKEIHNHLHGRVKDYSMSSEDLNKIVRDTASRGAGFGTTSGYAGTPSEQVGYQATEEYASRITSPRPASTVPKDEGHASPLRSGSTEPHLAADDETSNGQDGVIHVDEPGHKGYAEFGNAESADGQGAHSNQVHPILASDEVAKGASPYELQPAVMPPHERHGSSFEMEQPKSRPTSRPTSIYSPPPVEIQSTPLEDVEEYEPLFPEDGKEREAIQAKKLAERGQRFPSRDIWEDAPNSVHSTAEVLTPEPSQARSKSQNPILDLPPREGETPAQAFARKQEELAEKEATNPDSFLHRQQKPTWAEHQARVTQALPAKPNMARRFPSRDVWEDTPDSLQFTTTVSTPQSAEEAAEEAANSPVEPTTSHTATHKPIIPVRPKKQGSGDDSTSKPAIPERPKPQIPVRPTKAASESKESEAAAKQKPPVPSRPAGGKIAALQAGFMSDLNARLRLGPQAPKKEEAPTEEAQEDKPRAPLSDARKGRARGPQRRAPTKSSSQSTETSTPPPSSSNNGKPALTFSITRTLWSINEEGTMTVDDFGPEASSTPDVKTVEPKVERIEAEETKVEGPEVEEPPKTKEAETTTETEKKSNEAEPTENKGAAEEMKTLVSNTAGESILEETVGKKEQGDEVKEAESAKEEVVS